LNHVTLAVDRYQNTGYTKTGNWDQKIGLTGLPYDNGALPYVLFSGGTAAPLALSNPDFYWQGYTRYDYLDNLTYIRGRHSMKFGINYIHETNNAADGRTGPGQFTFSNAQTSQPDAGGNFSTWGSATASFLLGAVSAGQTQNRFPGSFIIPFWAWFAQDEWRLGKLTVSYGLRWEFAPANRERYDRVSNFDPTVSNPGANGYPGALVFGGNCSGCLGHGIDINTWAHGFAPRFGLAYALNSKTVIRASTGIYYSVNRVGPGTSGYSIVAAFSSPDGYSPAFNWEGGFPNFPRPPIIDPSLLNYQGVGYLSPGATRLPQAHTWTFSVQRQLAASLALEVNYIGTHTTHIPNGTLGFPDIVNQSYLSLGSTLLQKINSPAAVAAGIQTPYPAFVNSPYNTVAQALKPFPQYTSISGGDPTGVAHYEDLEVKLNKRYASGLTSQVFLTWTKNITNADGGTSISGTVFGPYQYPLNRAGEMSEATLGQPLVFGASFAYELPFGPGKRFVNGKGIGGRLAAGWELSGFVKYNDGTPLSVTVPNNLSPLGYPGKRANAVAGQPVHSQSDPRDFNPAASRFFNSSAFSIPGSFQLGNTARVLDWARSWTGKSETVSLRRSFRIYERAHLVARMDMDNPFNFVRWGNPITDLSSANFGMVSSTTNARLIQINMSFEF
jgi:hypothetical protein